MNALSINDVKIAMGDSEFRKKLPVELKEEVQKYEQNPGCGCNLGVYMKVLKFGKKQLQEFFPDRIIVEQENVQVDNHWTVINCHKDELESRLKILPPGRKYLAVARWEDQITVVVNELDFV